MELPEAEQGAKLGFDALIWCLSLGSPEGRSSSGGGLGVSPRLHNSPKIGA